MITCFAMLCTHTTASRNEESTRLNKIYYSGDNQRRKVSDPLSLSTITKLVAEAEINNISKGSELYDEAAIVYTSTVLVAS